MENGPVTSVRLRDAVEEESFQGGIPPGSPGVKKGGPKYQGPPFHLSPTSASRNAAMCAAVRAAAVAIIARRRSRSISVIVGSRRTKRGGHGDKTDSTVGGLRSFMAAIWRAGIDGLRSNCGERQAQCSQTRDGPPLGPLRRAVTVLGLPGDAHLPADKRSPFVRSTRFSWPSIRIDSSMWIRWTNISKVVRNPSSGPPSSNGLSATSTASS